MQNLKWKVILVLVLTAIAIYGIYPPGQKIKLGLDLKGGIHLVAEVKIDEALAGYTDKTAQNLRSELQTKSITFTNIVRQGNTSLVIDGVNPEQQANLKQVFDAYGEWQSPSFTGTQALTSMKPEVVSSKSDQAVEQAIRIIRERVDTFGVAEPVVQRQGLAGGRIIIQLPGVEDTDRVKNLIQGTAKLELRLVVAGPASTREGVGPVPPDSEIMTRTSVQQDGSSRTDYFIVKREAVVSGEDLVQAQRSSDEYGRPAVSFSLSGPAGETFGRFTEANVGKALAIVLDNKVQSAPNIQSRITTHGVITGQFTIQEANDLGVMLQSGALPAGLRFLEQRFVGPSLGLDSIKKGLMACAVAAIAIIVFMIVYYKLSGVNAIVALVLNMLYLMAFMSYFEATLTLPGIAGIVLSIGMAVDANVLIFERIKEDMRMGKTVRSALQSGFAKAFWPIFDSNITTVIGAVFLFWFGTGPVKGFAVTLITGIAASMFTAIWVSRLIFDLVYSGKKKVETISI